MSRIRTLVFIAAALLVSVVAAALPPQYQRLAELNAVLNHGDVVDVFGIDRPIDSIEYVGVDLYRVTGGECHMYVQIVGLPVPDGMVGARKFEVVPGDLECP